MKTLIALLLLSFSLSVNAQSPPDSIVQLKNIRFDNPMFSLTTTYNRADFTKLLTEQF